jgi:hypothetical protein
MDIDALMTQQGMRTFTDEQRETWMNDAVQMRQLAQIIQARLANTDIDGDKTGTAARRARKMAKRWGKLAGLLEQAAAQAEGINSAYVRDVLELPDRRAKHLERKEQRRHRLGIAATATHQQVAQSLHTSAHTLNGSPQYGNPQVTPVQPQPQYTPPMPHHFAPSNSAGQPVGDIADFFPEAL